MILTSADELLGPFSAPEDEAVIHAALIRSGRTDRLEPAGEAMSKPSGRDAARIQERKRGSGSVRSTKAFACVTIVAGLTRVVAARRRG
jgi:hypothetical protein